MPLLVFDPMSSGLRYQGPASRILYSVEMEKVCAIDADRSEQETIVHKVTRSETTYSEPVLEPEYVNALAAYISPLNRNYCINDYIR